MNRSSLVIALFAATCAKPLPEAILGEWEEHCRTDEESTSTCLGKEDDGLFKRFLPGGRLVSGARKGISMTGTWTLEGNDLVIAFEGGGMHLRESWRARIEDDRLVLWHATRSFGAVYGRVGAPFEAASSKASSAGGPTSHSIDDVGYTIALPPEYRLARDDNHRQEWAPSSGAGLKVQLTLSPRAKTQVDGHWVTPPCNDRDSGRITGSGGTIDGVMRDVSIGKSFCLDGSDRVLMCSGEHTRGYLEDGEKDAALAPCRSLTLN